MKINLVIGSFYPAVCYGGPVFSTLYTSRELARLGHQVYVSTTNANGDALLDVETNKFIQFEDNIFVKYYGNANKAGFSWPLLFNIWRDIKNADVIFIQSIFSSYAPVSLLYATLLRKPVMLSPRGSLGGWCLESKRQNIKRLWLKIFILPFQNLIYWHATSEQEKQDILSIQQGARVTIIPNGINISEFISSAQLSSAEYTKQFIGTAIDCCYKIISMGRLHNKKGFDILIDAFSVIKDEYPDSILLIAGPDGGELCNLQQQVIRYSLQNRVFFVGELTGQDKIDFLANGDIFVLPSHNENFGNVYAESLAAGTPVIASKNTPWQDVENHRCGKWVANTTQETAAAMRELLKLDLQAAGMRGSKYCHETFDWRVIGRKFSEEFTKLMEILK